MSEQYERFLTKENFTLAYKRLKTIKKHEYKDFYYHDFKAFEALFNQNIETLISDIAEEIYEPSSCEKYYMPKKKNLARPITLLTLIDQIVYQAIANVVADLFYPTMSRYFNLNTFGNLFIPTDAPNNIFFFEQWKTQWKKFNQNKKEAFEQGFRYSAEFDIASFYDTIDHGVLLAIMTEYEIGDELVALLNKCLSKWTVSATANLRFVKSCGIPQGPACSAFFAEIYLLKLDDEMRNKDAIKYFRYADDINIMAKTKEQCQKMIVYLDLLAREIGLIPQSEKIVVTAIENIDRHINNLTAKFSSFTKEYKKNNESLKESTHRRLKEKFLACFEPDKFNKTIIKFSLFKLNRDDEVKSAIIDNMDQMELFYQGVIYYFNKHYPNDHDFDQHILSYLLGDTVLFQYNKSLLFKNYAYLQYEDNIFSSNCRNVQKFWIVQYQMIGWLRRCNRAALGIECYDGENFFIRRRISYMKMQTLPDNSSKRVYLEKMIDHENPMTSLHGLYLWNRELFFEPPPEAKGRNNYAIKLLLGKSNDYFEHTMKSFWSLTPSPRCLELLRSQQERYRVIKEELRYFISYKDINPSISLMSLDLLHHALFDAIACDKNYTQGEFGQTVSQMNGHFPLTATSFDQIHKTRNRRTFAHYRDHEHKPRIRISQSEYNDLLARAKLEEAYAEIFRHYG